MTLPWTQDELDTLKNNYSTTNPKDLEFMFPGKTKSVIQHKANSLGLRLKDNRRLSRLLDGSLESCYWIGFILADGWVTEKITNRKLCTFGISLSEKDSPHLMKLGEYLNVPVNSYSRNSNKGESESNYCNITVNDNINVPLLKSTFLIDNDKTHNPPDLSKYNLSTIQLISLIIGYIDGDGSVAKRSNNRTVISVQCSIEWKDNLNFIIDTLSSFFEVETKNTASINCRGHATIYIGHQSLLLKIKDFIGVHHLPVLERKWGKLLRYNV